MGNPFSSWIKHELLRCINRLARVIVMFITSVTSLSYIINLYPGGRKVDARPSLLQHIV